MKQLARLLIVVSASCMLLGSAMAGSKGVVGTWMVFKNGKPNPMMKLIFNSNGTFKFAGSNYASSGYYAVRDGHIKLNWYSVDGQRVKVGTIVRMLDLSPEGTFAIDQYTYAKYR